MKILYVEDEIAHVMLAERTLEENLPQRFHLIHAEKIVDALAILEAQPDIDLVLSDLRLPDGTGLELLQRIRERSSPPAVVLVTGQGDEGIAVKALKAGAADYLVKQSDYLHRLPVVISNAVAQNRYIREQEALRQAEVRYQSLVEQISAVVFLDQANEAQTSLYISPRIQELTGYTAEEWRSDPDIWAKCIHPDDRQRVLEWDGSPNHRGERFIEEYRMIRRDGRVIWVKEDTHLICDQAGKPLYWQGILLNITREKENEVALQRQLEEIAVLHAASVATANALQVDELIEQVTRVIGDSLYPDNFGILLLDPQTNTLQPHPSYRGAGNAAMARPLPVSQGISGQVALSGQALRIGDVTGEPRYVEVTEGMRSELCVPIICQGQVVGVINTESRRQDAYSERDERLLMTIANTLATAMEKLRSFEDARQRATELEALYQASRSLALSLEPEIIGQELISIMGHLLGYEFASVYLLDEQRGILHPLAISQKAQDTENCEEERGPLPNNQLSIDVGIVGWVAGHGQPVRTGDVTKDARYQAVFRNIRSELCVPLIARGRAIGVLNIESEKANAYTERDESLLTALAASAAAALENARLYQDAVRAAERRAVLHRISQEIVRFSQDIEQIYAAIHDTASQLMACDVFLIVLHDTQNNENVPVYAVELGQRLLLGSVPGKGGLTGIVIDQGQSLILRNSNQINKMQVARFGSDQHVQSVVAAPLRIGGQVLGMISAQSYRPEAYTAEEQALLEMLATHAATAIENSRLFESEQKRRKEAETLRQAASVISSTLDPDHVLKEILNALKQVIPYDSASVFLLEGSQLRVAMAQGLPNAAELTGLVYSVGDELFEIIQRTGRPYILYDAQQDLRFHSWGNTSYVRGWMGIPLIARGRVTGYITLDNQTPGSYSESIVETALAFANQAAAGLENARLFQEQTRRAAIIAALADIANEIATTREVLPALDQIAQRALDLLNANDVAIYLVQDDGKTLKPVTAHGFLRSNLLEHSIEVGAGITGSVFLSGKPEIVNDTEADARGVTVPGTPDREEKLESLMSSPLILRGKSIGVINAWRLKENGLFNDSELSFLVGIAHQVSICVESGRLFEETNRQAQEAAAIAEVGRDISSTLQLDLVLERIAAYAMDLLHAETSAVYLTHAQTSTLHAIAALGLDAQAIKDDPLAIGSGILGNIALQNIGEIVNYTAKDPRTLIIRGTEKNPLEHLMGVPVLLKGQNIGLLAVWRSGTDTDFLPRELDFLTSLARQAAVAIENARLYNEAQRRLNELEIINRVSTSLRTTQSYKEMPPILLNEALQLANTPHGSLWLYDPASDRLVQQVASGTEARVKWTTLTIMDGLVGHAFRTGKTYVSPDLKDDPLLYEGNRESIQPGFSGVYIPIQSTAGPVGVLVLEVEKERQIGDEIHLLTILAEISGTSIHRAQLYEQSQKQVRRLTSLRDIDSAIASSFDLRLTLNILMDQTISHLNVDAVDIGLYYADLQTISFLPGLGFNVSGGARSLIRAGEGLAGQVIARQQTCHINDLQNAPEAANEALIMREKFVSYIGIPLIVKGQIRGVFEVFQRSPLSPTPDWMDFLQTLAGQTAIAIESAQLFENLQRSNQELIQAYDTTLEGWARALELRDRETEGHTRRVTELTMRLARYMCVSDHDMVNLHRGVLLHDIGKMGVPDHILKKKGKLTEEEWEEMRQHPTYAYNLLSPISFLRGAVDIPYCHHEWWNGEGYPRGLKGEQIPLSARIFAVVDNWDALLSDRPYRKAWPRKDVIKHLKENAGVIFDPKIVDIFLRMMECEEYETG